MYTYQEDGMGGSWRVSFQNSLALAFVGFLYSTAFGGSLDTSLALHEDVYKVLLKRPRGETFGIMAGGIPSRSFRNAHRHFAAEIREDVHPSLVASA